jgi:hypothetical protein
MIGRVVLAVAGLAVALWLAFQPLVANRLEYALPVANGLPCRLHAAGRDYENDQQCEGAAESAWRVWYNRHNRVTPGGACERPAALKRTGDWPLHQISTVWTLGGPPHAVVSAERSAPMSDTQTVIYVQDGPCYRPYSLLGGP